MKKSETSFDSIPNSALSVTSLAVCLKCAFDFFTKQLKLSVQKAYSELKKHVPEETDFTGASTSRPHFFVTEEVTHCPYCNGSKQWFAQFLAYRIDAHPSFEKERKKLWTALRKEPDRFTIWKPERTPMQVFSEWLDRLKRSLDFEDDNWLIHVGLEQIKRSAPSNQWNEILKNGVRRIQISRQLEGDWNYEEGRLYVSPIIYGDILMVQHLLSRSHLHGGRTFEGRLTLQELIWRLRRMGYLEARQIEAHEPFEIFEQAVTRLVDSGPAAVYYAVDRSQYLEKLKAIYDKKRKK